MVLLGFIGCFAQVKEEASESELVGDTAVLTDTETVEDTAEEQEEDTGPDLEQDFELEIIGSYSDMLDNQHDISDDFWIMDVPEDGEYLYHLREIYNDNNFLIARNDNQNGTSEGGLWSRFDWTWDSQNNLWFCQTTYTAESQQEAFDTAAPNVNDLSLNGCNGFGWLKLNPN